jgi:hypothetical protein
MIRRGIALKSGLGEKNATQAVYDRIGRLARQILGFKHGRKNTCCNLGKHPVLCHIPSYCSGYHAVASHVAHADSFPTGRRYCPPYLRRLRSTPFPTRLFTAPPTVLCPRYILSFAGGMCGDRRMIDRIYGTGGTRSDKVVEKTKKNM